MKTKILSCFICLFLVCNLAAQNPVVFEEWTSYEGTQNLFYKNISKTDYNRNVFVAGATVNATGNYDILLTKYDAEGTQLWVQQYSGATNGDAAASSLCFDNNGNIYITGTIFHTTQQNNCVTIKYNQSGVLQWVRTYNGNASGDDFGIDIVSDQENNVYISGACTQSGTLYDFLVLKYDDAGTLQWSNTYNNANLNDVSNKIRTYDDIVVVAGGAQTSATEWEYAICEFDGGSGTFNGVNISNSSGAGIDKIMDLSIDAIGNVYVTGGVVNQNNDYDYFTMKLDTDLVVMWSATYNGNDNLDDIANAIDVDYNGNVYVTGYSTSNSQGTDYVTIKYNSSGTQQWIETFNNSSDGNDKGTGLALDNSGNIYVTGESYNGHNLDFYTLKYDASGNLLWEIGHNGIPNDNDFATDICIDFNGDIVVVGQSLNGADYHYLTVKYSEQEVIIPPDNEALSSSMAFIENREQLLNTSQNAVPDIKYYSQHSNPSLYFANDKLSYVFTYRNEDEETQDYSRVDMSFVDASDDTKVRAMYVNENYTNYYLGHIPEGRERVQNYDRLIYKDVFENIDILFASNNVGLKYYIIVKPGGVPSLIKLNYTGANSLSLGGSDELIINTDLDDILQPQATAFQIDANGNKVTLGWQPDYDINGTEISFDIGSYNSSLDLVIQVDWGGELQFYDDPGLCWGTYFGGNTGESARGIDVNNNNNQYITGETTSSDFPIQGNSSSNNANGNKVFISKFLINHKLDWSTYYGGTDHQIGNDVKCKSNGNIFIVGTTCANDFPLKPKTGAQPTSTYTGSAGVGFILEFNTGGFSQWAIYFGSTGGDQVLSLDFDNGSNFYIVGHGRTTNFPVKTLTGAYNQSIAGITDAFIAKFDNNCFLTWCTFYGGSNWEKGRTVKVDAQNNVYVHGVTGSSNFPTLDPGNNAYYDNSLGGNNDDWIVKFSSSGVRQWATLIGGSNDEWVLSGDAGNSIAFDNQNNIYLVGATPSSDFPVDNSLPGYYYGPPTNTWSDHAGYIMEFNASNYSLMWSTFISGSGTGQVHLNAIDINSSNKILIGGSTGNANFPIIAEQSMYNQPSLTLGIIPQFTRDACILGFNSAHNLIYGTFFGGDNTHSEGDLISDLVINNNDLFFTGITSSCSTTVGGLNIPLFNPGNNAYYDPTFNQGYNDAFIAKQCIGNMVGTNEFINNNPNHVHVYPNPTSNEFNLTIMSNVNQQIEISIFDYTGRLVKTDTKWIDNGSKIYSMSINELDKGVYIIHVNSPEINHSSKLMKL